MKPDTRLLQLTGNLRSYLAVTSGLGVLGGVAAVLQALCVSQAVAGVFVGGEGLSQVRVWVWLLLGVIAARSLLLLAGEVSANGAAGQAKLRLRGPFFSKLLALGPAYMWGERSGELVGVASDGVESLDAYFSLYLPQLFNTVLVPLVVALAVFGADLLSGVVLLLTMPVLPIFMILVGKMAEGQARKQWRTLGLMSAHFLDVLSGLSTLKLFGRSIIQKEIIARISEQHRDATMSVLRVAFLSALVLEMAATISTAVIAVEIGLRLLYGGIPFAQAFFVLLLAPEFYMPFRALGTRFHAAMAGEEAAGRIISIVGSEEGRKTKGPEPAKEGRKKTDGVWPAPVPDLTRQAIRFENVSYSYEPDGGSRPGRGSLVEMKGRSPARGLGVSPRNPPLNRFVESALVAQELMADGVDIEMEAGASLQALRSVSFSIEPGSMTAFVGPSGGGKSTIANLLLRFIEPSAGAIYVGDTLLNQCPADEWRNDIAWVPQRPYLFHATVAENIRLGKPDASMQETERAARAAHAHDFIMALRQGYDTVIGERGARLSGGQAQRIGLARALLKDASLLVLDEATSNLDAENERLVMRSVERLMKERTVVIIAHRLATIRNASRVIVLDGGRVVESGDREDGTTRRKEQGAFRVRSSSYGFGPSRGTGAAS